MDRESPKAQNQLRFSIMLALCLIAAYCILTWPLGLNWKNQLLRGPGGASITGMPERDMGFWLWCVWWGGESAAQWISPYFCHSMNYPFGVSLILTPITAPYGALFAPLRDSLGPVFIFNVWIMILAVMSSLGTAWIALELNYGRRAAILAAGLIFLVPFQRTQMVSHLNIASTAWPILTLLFLIRLRKHGRWREAVWAGLFGAITLYTSHYHFFFLLIVVGLALIWEIFHSRGETLRSRERHTTLILWSFLIVLCVAPTFATIYAYIALLIFLAFYLALCLGSQWNPATRRRILQFLLFVLITSVLSSPLLLPLASGEGGSDNDPAKSLSSKVYFSNTPLTPFLTPRTAAWVNRAAGISEDDMWRFRADEEFANSPGLVALVLGVMAIGLTRKKRRGSIWLFLAICMYVLSLGPYLRFPSLIRSAHLPFTGIVLPASIFYTFPMLQAIRVFSRFAFYFDLFLCLFIVSNFSILTEAVQKKFRMPPGILVTLLLALIILERWEWGMPVMKVVVPPAYEKMAELPAGPAWFLPDEAVGQALFGQTIHRLPLANVLLSREDPSYSKVKESSIAWQYFQILEQMEMDLPLPGVAAADAIRNNLLDRGIQYVVLMNPHFSAQQKQWLPEALMRDLRLHLVFRDEELTVLSLNPL